MRQYWNAPWVLVAVLLVGCSTTGMEPASERVGFGSELDRLLELDEEWSAAVASSNVEAILDCLSDDVYVAPMGYSAVKGKHAIRAHVQMALAVWSSPWFPIECKTLDVRFSPDGELAYMLQTNTLLFSRDSVLTRGHGHGTKVWRRQPNGAWKCVVYMWNDARESSPDSDFFWDGDG